MHGLRAEPAAAEWRPCVDAAALASYDEACPWACVENRLVEEAVASWASKEQAEHLQTTDAVDRWGKWDSVQPTDALLLFHVVLLSNPS